VQAPLQEQDGHGLGVAPLHHHHLPQLVAVGQQPRGGSDKRNRSWVPRKGDSSMLSCSTRTGAQHIRDDSWKLPGATASQGAEGSRQCAAFNRRCGVRVRASSTSSCCGPVCALASASARGALRLGDAWRGDEGVADISRGVEGGAGGTPREGRATGETSGAGRFDGLAFPVCPRTKHKEHQQQVSRVAVPFKRWDAISLYLALESGV
jgi:hypothetical protein